MYYCGDSDIGVGAKTSDLAVVVAVVVQILVAVVILVTVMQRR